MPRRQPRADMEAEIKGRLRERLTRVVDYMKRKGVRAPYWDALLSGPREERKRAFYGLVRNYRDNQAELQKRWDYAAAVDWGFFLGVEIIPEHEQCPRTPEELLARIEAGAENLVDLQCRFLMMLGEGLVPDRPAGFRHAVLVRAAESMPWVVTISYQDQDSACYTGALVNMVALLHPELGEPYVGGFPDDISRREFTGWLKNVPDKFRSGLEGSVPPEYTYLAPLCSAMLRTERERQTPRVAVDAGRPHHALLTALTKWDGAYREFTQVERIELILPDQPIQLSLRIEGLHEEVIKSLQNLAGPRTLRHYSALLRLFAVEGGRSGFVRWTLDDHLRALGYKGKGDRHPELLRRAAETVELLTKIEIAAYDKTGTMRLIGPIISIRKMRLERNIGKKYHLNGAVIDINPLLYSGVRNPNTRRVGSNWFPVPVKLPTVDERRYPYFYPLGLLLPIRMRLALRQGKDHLALSGANLLEMGGIKYKRNNPARAWGKLHRTLDKLREVGELRRWAWDGGQESLQAICRLYPADWALDGIIRGLKPAEALPPPQITTGDELRAYRQQESLTQAELAARLGVSRRTIARAEGRKTELLPAPLRRKMTHLAP